MPTTAPYDDVADWYENEFLALQRSLGERSTSPPVVLSAWARKTNG